MSKKLIGLTGPSSFTDECVKMVEDFFDADFVMLYHNNSDSLNSWVDRCDAIILAGGVDIHPTTVDQSCWNGQNLSKFDLNRDIRELQILERCRESNKPYLGICRGHQLIGVRAGLFLIPDISCSTVAHQPSRQQINLSQTEPAHYVQLLNPEQYYEAFPGREPKERLWFSRIMGYDQNTKLWTNSFHHQALAYPNSKKDKEKKMPIPKGITVYGVARIDMQHFSHIIELMGGENWVSCQWHPEYDWQVNSASRAVLERFKTLINRSMQGDIGIKRCPRPSDQGVEEVEQQL